MAALRSPANPPCGPAGSPGYCARAGLRSGAIIGESDPALDEPWSVGSKP
jgi:hypothetical protein